MSATSSTNSPDVRRSARAPRYRSSGGRADGGGARPPRGLRQYTSSPMAHLGALFRGRRMVARHWHVMPAISPRSAGARRERRSLRLWSCETGRGACRTRRLSRPSPGAGATSAATGARAVQQHWGALGDGRIRRAARGAATDRKRVASYARRVTALKSHSRTLDTGNGDAITTFPVQYYVPNASGRHC